jgi:hypothetical protein
MILTDTVIAGFVVDETLPLLGDRVPGSGHRRRRHRPGDLVRAQVQPGEGAVADGVDAPGLPSR